MRPPRTGIGSVPDRTVEAALRRALAVELPYWPQLVAIGASGPSEARGASSAGPPEGLRAQALAPAAADGLPVAAHARALRPWLDALEAQRPAEAKVQLAGPSSLAAPPGAASEAGAVGEAEAIGIVASVGAALLAAVRARGVAPLLVLDEPVLPARGWPRALAAALERLRPAARASGARLGLHACGALDPAAVLAAATGASGAAEGGLDDLLIDAALHLEPLLAQGPALGRFLEAGGRLGLGLVPTDRRPGPELLETAEAGGAALARRLSARLGALASRCLLSPACGLGLHSVADADTIDAALAAAARGWAAGLETG